LAGFYLKVNIFINYQIRVLSLIGLALGIVSFLNAKKASLTHLNTFGYCSLTFMASFGLIGLAMQYFEAYRLFLVQ
jgi:hypothetical protein